MMRLDLFLHKNGYTASRTEAQNFIEGGFVTLDGRLIDKSSFQLDESAPHEVLIKHDSKKYVSRGGFKLEGALDAFSVEVCGRTCLDVGASSGGFTDCLLQRGAVRVYAVDSGEGQLSAKLSEDARVRAFEKFNARYMKKEDFDGEISLAVMDVSFISSTYIIPAVFDCLACGGDFITLIKPQFEVGRANVGKGGIVKDEKTRKAACEKVISFATSVGFTYISLITSSIKGGDGNVEYLAHFKKESDN